MTSRDGRLSLPHAVFSTRRDWWRIAELAAAQHGVVALGQLLALGAARQTVQSWVASGKLIQLHAGVYAVGHAVLRVEGHYLGAVLACGPGAALSYRSAGAHRELRATAASAIDVTSPIRTGRKKPGLRVHRGDRLASDEIEIVDAIPCTTISRTMLDLAVVLDLRGLQAVVETAERIGKFDLRSLTILLARHWGRRGTRKLRIVLEAFDPEVLRCRSETEARFFHLCRERICLGDIPMPLVNRKLPGRLRDYEADFHWPGAKLIVETDSPYHDTAEAQIRDASRDADLGALGWTTLRPRWDDIVTSPSALITNVHTRLTA